MGLRPNPVLLANEQTATKTQETLMFELLGKTRATRWKVTPIAGIDPMGDALSDGPGRASIGLQTAGDARQEIERVRPAGNADGFSRPTSRTGGAPMTKGLRRTDQGIQNLLTKGLETG